MLRLDDIRAVFAPRAAPDTVFLPVRNDLIINEILFNPYVDGVDFVEVYNRSDKTFDLRQFKLATRNKNGAVASYKTPESRHLIYPDDYAVLTTSAEATEMFYRVPYPERIVVLPSLPAYNNADGCVVLTAEDSTIIDEFCYTEKMHQSLLVSVEGVSLERVSPERPAGEAANWYSGSQVVGFATPTYKNSAYFGAGDADTQEPITLSPAVFTPDGDGTDDVLFIDYVMPDVDFVANVYIYDASGRLVRELHKNALLGKDGRLLWDGADGQGRRVPIGVYIVVFQAHSQSGKTQTWRKTVVAGANL
jgi:hypothetical protein